MALCASMPETIRASSVRFDTASVESGSRSPSRSFSSTAEIIDQAPSLASVIATGLNAD